MSPAILTPERVRELTAHCHAPVNRHRNAGRRAYKLTSEKMAEATRMIQVEGKTYKEAAASVGCSLSRLYGAIAKQRRERIAIGGAA